jgi:hypothetical protein
MRGAGVRSSPYRTVLAGSEPVHFDRLHARNPLGSSEKAGYCHRSNNGGDVGPPSISGFVMITRPTDLWIDGSIKELSAQGTATGLVVVTPSTCYRMGARADV